MRGTHDGTVYCLVGKVRKAGLVRIGTALLGPQPANVLGREELGALRAVVLRPGSRVISEV